MVKEEIPSVPFVDLGRIHQPINEELINVTKKIIESSEFVLGQHLKEFEKEFSKYVGTQFGLGVASGADALFLALKAVGIKPGDEVITVNNTFNATVDAIIRVGAIPKIIDVRENNLLMNHQTLEKIITERTKAIIPVHLYGNPVDLESLIAVRNEQNQEIRIIQDAAQSHGATFANKPLGKFGDVLCYSFYPAKNLGALGEGGFIATNDFEVIERIKILRNCGQKSKYIHTKIGYNSRLENLQAAYLSIKLAKLDEWNLSRRKTAQLYQEMLTKCKNIRIVEETEKGESVYHLFVIRLKQRNKMIEIFKRKQIYFGIHYPIPINKAEAYRKYDFSKEAFPLSECAANEIISLPMFPLMTEQEILTVVEAVKQYEKQV